LPASRKQDLLVDADVLIDYLKTDESILQLAGCHVATLHVTSLTVAEEVDGLDGGRCARLGLRVVEPDLEQVVAAAGKRGPFSFHDVICLLVAKERAWNCLTNDKALRHACEAEGVGVTWGLELMVKLVATRHLTRLKAVEVAEAIHRTNPTHITAKIINRFKSAVLKRS